VLIIFTALLQPGIFSHDVDKPARHEPQSLINLLQEWYPVCTFGRNNVVPPRRDGCNTVLHDMRSWSLTAEDLFTFSGVSHPNLGKKDSFWSGADDLTIRQNDLPVCTTLEDLLQSFSLPLSEATCRSSWLSTESMCHVLVKYSSVVWNGDSLLRHMSNALFALLTQNLRYGAYPVRDCTRGDEVLPSCGCDGQFSEAMRCRTYDMGRLAFREHHLK
jgi:hypothetical protein